MIRLEREGQKLLSLSVLRKNAFVQKTKQKVSFVNDTN